MLKKSGTINVDVSEGSSSLLSWCMCKLKWLWKFSGAVNLESHTLFSHCIYKIKQLEKISVGVSKTSDVSLYAKVVYCPNVAIVFTVLLFFILLTVT